MSSSGPVPTSPATLRQTILNDVAATNPDYTANLPGSLVEDVLSTEVGSVSQIDQARVDAVNSVTPYGANAFVLAMLGAQAGLSQGTPTNTSVYVVISGTAGYVIPAGFLVSDGTHQYAIQNGGVVESTGSTAQLYAVATQSGTWAVPAATVTQIVTSVSAGYTLTVTNPEAGIPATSEETVQSYRSRVIEAQKVTVQGTPAFLTTLLQAVPGVIPRLVTIYQVQTGWEIICGGGDPYAVANAIFQGTLDLSSIFGSLTDARNITVTLIDGPNTYTLAYVNPPQQVVTVAAAWNTTLSNFTAASQVNQLAAVALQSYINGILVGQPINLLEMTNAFQTAITSVLDPNYLTTLTFVVTINGVVTDPKPGTSIILSDAESYFYASASGITVAQG